VRAHSTPLRSSSMNQNRLPTPTAMHSTDLPEALEYVLNRPGMAELGPGPRMNILSRAEIDHTLERVGIPHDVAELIRALLLLWNDHHDAAHAIVQDCETPDGNLIHAILHRREPDYSNARYWFHRVGAHPCFAPLARQVEHFLTAEGNPSLLHELVKKGQWDPEAVISACLRVSKERHHVVERVTLQKIQQIETRVLLHHLLTSEM
jgi:hypothetical protein